MKKAKILIVEDDPDTVIAIEDQLKSLGHTVFLAYDGREALKKVEEHKPDLIVLDILMPKMDGYDVCNHLKSSPGTKNIPIMMLTAKGLLQDKIKGFNKGADDYLIKPYDKAEFESRITALLNRAQCLPYEKKICDTYLYLSCEPVRFLNIRLKGKTLFNAVSKEALDLDIDVLTQYARNVRCEAAMKDRNDLTWISPVLIMQD